MAKNGKLPTTNGYVTIVEPDAPDIRDRYYEPALISIARELPKPKPTSYKVLDQGTEGACTGFGLAAVINRLNAERGLAKHYISPWMLYYLAKRHDEWPGHTYDGSSCRGAIRGWSHMGVCAEGLWPKPDAGLSVEQAKDARNNPLGAYYRLRPDLTDYHAALNEAGALYVSAEVHEGWAKPTARNPVIKPSDAMTGGHAFAIVGYNDKGFWVQNSWGRSWGDNGIALWLYEDWLDNVYDGWAVRLALPVPQIFGLKPRQRGAVSGDALGRPDREPRRTDVAGHFVHVDDGDFKEKGTYWSSAKDVRETAELILKSKNYDHLLIYAHGGLNSPEASARRIKALKEGFKRNRIYPFHVMYDTGLAEELKDVVLRSCRFWEGRAGGISDWSDRLIEGLARRPGTPLWDEMKRDARVAFEGKTGGGLVTMTTFIEVLRDRFAGKGNAKSFTLHLAGHSTGGVLIGHLLQALDKSLAGIGPLDIGSCSLFAPACTNDFFLECYAPHLGAKSNAAIRLRQTKVYNLTDRLEQDDNVAKAYRKSLLYLVSRAFERTEDAKILGMEKYARLIEKRDIPTLKFVYSDGDGKAPTASTSHGGFDNDANTMNDLLRNVLGKAPPEPFTPEEMQGY